MLYKIKVNHKDKNVIFETDLIDKIIETLKINKQKTIKFNIRNNHFIIEGTNETFSRNDFTVRPNSYLLENNDLIYETIKMLYPVQSNVFIVNFNTLFVDSNISKVINVENNNIFFEVDDIKELRNKGYKGFNYEISYKGLELICTRNESLDKYVSFNSIVDNSYSINLKDLYVINSKNIKRTIQSLKDDFYELVILKQDSFIIDFNYKFTVYDNDVPLFSTDTNYSFFLDKDSITLNDKLFWFSIDRDLRYFNIYHLNNPVEVVFNNLNTFVNYYYVPKSLFKRLPINQVTYQTLISAGFKNGINYLTKDHNKSNTFYLVKEDLIEENEIEYKYCLSAMDNVTYMNPNKELTSLININKFKYMNVFKDINNNWFIRFYTNVTDDDVYNFEIKEQFILKNVNERLYDILLKTHKYEELSDFELTVNLEYTGKDNIYLIK